METTSKDAPALRADDARLLALGRQRRRERLLVPVAPRQPLLPEGVRLGRVRGRRQGRRRGGEALTTRRAAPTELDPRQGHPGTDFLWSDGRLVDAWPATPGENEYSRVRRSNIETLLIGGALDFATPPQIARKELLPYLPNGRQVVLPGFGHTDSFWADQPEAGTRLINTFLASGRVDDSLYKPQKVDFTPEVSDASLGKGFAGTMVGLGLITVLSLLWLPRRVHKRGRFGRKSSATLRSLYPIVLGLGGWFAGVLIVIDDDAHRAARRRAARDALGRPADRAGHLLRLGQPRLVRQDEDRGIRGGDQRARSPAPGSGST